MTRRAELGAVADGDGVADAEQVGEPERVAAGGLGFSQKPVGAQLLRGDAQPAHGGVDVAAVDGLEAAGGALVDQQVRAGGRGPASAPGMQPCAQVFRGELVQWPDAAADEQRASGGVDVVQRQGADVAGTKRVHAGLSVVIIGYAVLGTATILVLRILARRWRRDDGQETVVPYGPQDHTLGQPGP
jgi:hypothetical protein